MEAAQRWLDCCGTPAASGPDGRRGDRAADLCRRGREERPVSVARLAARRDGRPDAGLRADSRGDHGGGRRLSCRARVSADAGGHALAGGGATVRSRSSPGMWRVDGGIRGADRRRAKRHQAHPGLLDRLATRLHDGGLGHGRRGGGHVSSDHARFLQGAALHGRGLGHPRLPRGAGHSPHGRTEGRDAAGLSSTYAVGMLALCGFPLFFSGFWSKDGILDAAQHWSVAREPVLPAGRSARC